MSPRVSEKKCLNCVSLVGHKCLAEKTVKLSNYKPGQRGKIVQICGDPDFRLRLMEMGFVRGTEIQVVKYAPLNDPMEFVVKGYHITLRKKQAAHILMNEPEIAA
ncbi:MAG: FeoA family protein [Desulfomonilaceae bacterium]